MANLNQAFDRIVPRYEYTLNQGKYIVEDLDHDKQVTIGGNSARRIKSQITKYPGCIGPCSPIQTCYHK